MTSAGVEAHLDDTLAGVGIDLAEEDINMQVSDVSDNGITPRLSSQTPYVG